MVIVYSRQYQTPMIWIGTSGYNYPEWKGSFYPADLAAAKMLPYYAARFPTVEINYTFYRMPNEKLVAGWAAQTPSPYKLTLKAPRRITHDSRLKNCGELVRRFCGVAGTLGDKLGALLFQLPPNLEEGSWRSSMRFWTSCRRRRRAAFEFRHPSWLDDEVFERLRQTESGAVRRRQREDVHACADHRRLRLLPAARRRATRPDDIARWADTIAARDGRVPGRVRLFQARRRRQRTRVRAAADGRSGTAPYSR